MGSSWFLLLSPTFLTSIVYVTSKGELLMSLNSLVTSPPATTSPTSTIPLSTSRPSIAKCGETPVPVRQYRRRPPMKLSHPCSLNVASFRGLNAMLTLCEDPGGMKAGDLRSTKAPKGSRSWGQTGVPMAEMFVRLIEMTFSCPTGSFPNSIGWGVSVPFLSIVDFITCPLRRPTTVGITAVALTSRNMVGYDFTNTGSCHWSCLLHASPSTLSDDDIRRAALMASSSSLST
mmetsp:Transcript_7873/g.19663  ORF Transcript_7873/g.19663 Transcript_7873/m.19663 type:complete len:232 (+) Transcript_7873:231-926(+)